MELTPAGPVTRPMTMAATALPIFAVISPSVSCAAPAAHDTEGLMTAKIGSAVAAMVIGRVTGPAGVNSILAALAQADQNLAGPLNVAQVRSQNVAADLAERGGTVKYPAVNVYCEQIVNQMTEKFRMFSGTVQMAVEVRHSQDR